jgi:hypothetical protein
VNTMQKVACVGAVLLVGIGEAHADEQRKAPKPKPKYQSSEMTHDQKIVWDICVHSDKKPVQTACEQIYAALYFKK